MVGTAAVSTAAAAVDAGSSFIETLLGGKEDAEQVDASTVLEKLGEMASGGLNSGLLGEEAMAELQAFRNLLLSRMSEAGIDTSLSFHLESDGAGGVQMAGDHPNKENIEQLFEENPDLRIAFNYLDGTFGLMKAQEDYQALKESLSQDTMFGTAGSMSTSSEGNSDQFQVRVNGAEMEILFGGDAFSFAPAAATE